jgi:hypothetical protein
MSESKSIGAGKGDSPRKVKLDKYGETIERVYGERDFMDFHKGVKSVTKIEKKDDFNVVAEVDKDDSTKINVSFQFPIKYKKE